ncbi:PQQ-dependent dehydrogenase, methanol/ethanol family [Phenylobacterium sp.]|jgi:quinohemoprotein ethanol dehydrogenase|uniref:PQQ-dependent dehydrogenase, methanol/ethanol family n=1 Tax=Phenylobacterium sp. TaxID=1871053 RepID=UPI0037836662
MKVQGWMAAAGLAVAMLVAGCGSGDGAKVGADPGEWRTYGRTYDEQRFSPLNQVNRETVGKLGVAWWAEFDTDRGQEATPLVADGVIYTTTAWSKIHAFDARTGAKLWSYDPKVPGQSGLNACCDVVNRGAALWDGKVFFGTIDGRLIALDAKTGKPVWDVQTTDRSRPYTITGAPRVVKGKVLIGNGGAEYGVRGYVSAYDAATGKLAWRFYTAPNPTGAADGAVSDKILKEKAVGTWSDGAWKQTGGGGTVWDAITYDPKTDLVYVGVGNGSPWNHKIRSGGKGDNLFLSSIVALKPDTGDYVWHYQTTPAESWDYTATQHIMVADLPIGGATRRVVMQAPKNGFFYVLDAATGKLISGDKYIPAGWAERIDLATGRPVETPAARYNEGAVARHLPNGLGGHNWQPMAFSPKTGLVYIPSLQMHGRYEDDPNFQYRSAFWNTGVRRIVAAPSNKPGTEPSIPPTGELLAWDPVAKTTRWKVALPSFWTGGVLATDGGLVFQASGKQLVAYDAQTGARVWAYELGAAAIAPPITYALDGEQHLALMVGYGGASASDQPRRPGRLVVFKLGGTGKLPPYAEVAALDPLDLTQGELSAGDPDKGAAHFSAMCAVCHRGGKFYPDLARSPVILSRAAFESVVLDGALAQNGMASFRKHLTPAAAEDLRAFLIWQARTAPPPPPGAKGHPQ